MFLSSHVLSEVGRYCKHAAVIREGRILVSDSVDKLGHTGVKRVVLRGVRSFEDFEEARDITFANDTVKFLYSGDQKELLIKLCSASFEDITVTDPDLEEVFLHYYTREEN